MKWKSTVGLVLAFGALALFYFLYDKNAKTGEEAARDSKRVFHIEEKSIRTIRIVRPEGSLRLERSGADRWTLSEPFHARADRSAAGSAAGAVADLQQARSVKNERGAQGLEEMGLAKPRARVEFTLGPEPPAGQPSKGAAAGSPANAATPAPGPSSAAGSSSAPTSPADASPRSAQAAPSTGSAGSAAVGRSSSTTTGGAETTLVVEFGADVPASSSVFARIPGRDEILLVPSSAAAPFLKAVEEFRDRSLLDVTALDIGEAAFSRESGELRFRRRDEEWWVDKPFEDLAAGDAVQSLLSAVVGLRAEKFLDPSTPAEGLDPARTTIRLFDIKGAELATIRIGAAVPGENGKVYARADLPGSPGSVVTVASAGLDGLSKPAPEFRSRKALSFRTWEIAGLNLTSPKSTLSFEKKGGDWTASSPSSLKVDAAAVEQTLQLVTDLEVASFDVPAGASPASLDLEPPRTKIEVKTEAPGGKVKTLVLGSRAGAGKAVYARALGRPGFFTVDGSILERIEGGPTLYAAHEAPPAAPASRPSGDDHPAKGP